MQSLHIAMIRAAGKKGAAAGRNGEAAGECGAAIETSAGLGIRRAERPLRYTLGGAQHAWDW